MSLLISGCYSWRCTESHVSAVVIDWHCSSIRRGKTTFVDASKLAGELSEQACNSLVVDNKKVYWPAAALVGTFQPLGSVSKLLFRAGYFLEQACYSLVVDNKKVYVQVAVLVGTLQQKVSVSKLLFRACAVFWIMFLLVMCFLAAVGSPSHCISRTFCSDKVF